jgi:hypothetical protein
LGIYLWISFKSPWISPASLSLSPYDENLFKGFPATFIMAGEAEIALDSIETFRDRLSQNIGEDNVTYIAMKDGESPIDLHKSIQLICREVTHDVVTTRWFEPERTYAIMEIATWIGQVLD